jgi:hypothetical protein
MTGKWACAGRGFTSIAQMQQAAPEWCIKVAGRWPGRPLGGAVRLAVFDAVKAEHLSLCRGAGLCWPRRTRR